MTWECKSCGEHHPEDGWYWRKSGKHAGVRLTPCKECSRERARVHHREKDSPERRKRRSQAMQRWRTNNPDGEKDVRLRCTFNITLDQYNAQLVKQGDACAICGTLDPRGKGGFHVDHDRRCCPGKRSCGLCVRGLLCTRCNVGIAMFNDNVAAIAAAIDYLDGGGTWPSVIAQAA